MEQLQGDHPIGYGAFGVVWNVKDPRDGKRVALKKMPYVFHNVVAAKRVLRELKLLYYFNHENVLSALDIIPPLETPYQEIYILTPLMETDLHKIIASQQVLSLGHVRLFLYQILRGLKYLHAGHLLHRDIKPGNLLVNSDCRLKICDFGLARIDESDHAKVMTQEVVTQFYRPPELLLGVSHYNSAIDVWSVGCIFFELLTRNILFPAKSMVHQMDMIYEMLSGSKLPCLNQGLNRMQFYENIKDLAASPDVYLRLFPNMTYDAAHLLSRFLQWNPSERPTCTEALQHIFVRDGRLRYHNSLCHCCWTTATGVCHAHGVEFEPVPEVCFTYVDDPLVLTLQDAREAITSLIKEKPLSMKLPLQINPSSAVFPDFVSSTAAHLAPSTVNPSQNDKF